MDDCPIGLFYTRAACIDECKYRDIHYGLIQQERDVLNTDASTPLGFVMVEFVGGKPVKRTIIKWKDE